MKPRDFHHLALRLAEHGTSPPEFRTAISRAYFAVFNLGVELLEDMGFSIPKNAEGHKDLYLYFANSGDADIPNVANQLNNLRTKRNHADYRLAWRDIERQETAKLYAHNAGRMIDTLNSICSGKRRDQMIQSIQEWRQKISKAAT